MTRLRCGSRAFVAAEAVAIAAVGVILFGIVLVSTADTRRQSRLDRDLGNLRQIGAWTFAYAGDYQDLYPTFSAVPNSIYPDLRATAAGSSFRQAAGHAIDIIRRRTGRETFPLLSGWFPHLLYSHLVLVDYAQRDLPDTTFVSTGDEHRLNWLDDPINRHDEGFWQPFQNPESGPTVPDDWRWPYSGSFQTPPGWVDRSENGGRIWQFTQHSWTVTHTNLGAQHLSDVAFPAHKVMMHDYGAWHFTRQPIYFANEEARATVLMSDGGAGARTTTDANPGWYPAEPQRAIPIPFAYIPRPWEPPAIDPIGFDRVIGHYRWTRGGIRGRDFDGPEIDTGQK